ncbi:hypothetical protein [Desulfurobacterium sp.]
MGDLTESLLLTDKNALEIVSAAEDEAARIVDEANEKYSQIIKSYLEKAEEEKSKINKQIKREIENYRKAKEKELQKVISGFEKLSRANREKFIEKVFNNLRGRICG